MIRLVLLLVLLAVHPLSAVAQQAGFRVATNACVNPGQQVRLTGRRMGTAPVGDIVMHRGGSRIAMQITGWSDRRLRVQVPRQGVQSGAEYEIEWIRAGRVVARFGAMEVCGRVATRNPGRRAGRDEVAAPNGAVEYVVSVTAGQANAASNALQGQGGQLLRTRQLPSLGRVLLFFSLPGNLGAAQAQTILNGVANSARIDEHNIYGYAAGPRLYAAAAIGDQANSACRLRRPVAVGLIDGPVNPGHPALRGVSVKRVSVLGQRDRPPGPDHGTAVAALVAGNGSGSITGFAPGARIFAVSAFSTGRGGTGADLEHVAAGLDWLAGNGVRIVNMSFAGRPNAAFEDILGAAARKRMVMVGASGNDGKAVAAYPAGSPNVIAVSAVDANGRLYRKSNRGRHIEFAAPGVELYTAKGNGGGYQTGTSFAAPIVTAIIARRASRGAVSSDAVRAALRRTARDLGPGGRDTSFGWGLVQAGGC